MPKPFDDICCARIPRAALPLLAGLRCEPSLRAAMVGAHAWLRFDAGDERVLAAVWPIHDVLLFRFQGGRWHRFGSSLPEFDFAGDLEYEPLAHVLFPEAMQPIPPPALRVQPVRLTLAPDDQPRAATALFCPLVSLLTWCDSVPTVRLEAIEGALLGGDVLLLGNRLPSLPRGERFWGRDVLTPLGYAPGPLLSETALKAAAGVGDDELLFWRSEQPQAIERALFAPLTRAGLRLAAREARP